MGYAFSEIRLTRRAKQGHDGIIQGEARTPERLARLDTREAHGSTHVRPPLILDFKSR